MKTASEITASRRATRPATGIMVHVKDVSRYSNEALEKLKENRPDAESCTPRHEWGCVRTQSGLSVLCTEGIGEDVPFNGKFTLEFYGDYAANADGAKSFDMLVFQVNVSAVDFEALPNLREVPLEQFIRTFGRRLEDNFHEWHNSLRGK